MRFAVVLVVVVLAACRPVGLCADKDVRAGDTVTCEVDGWVDRAFRLDVPASWDGTSELPVIVTYHGGGGNREAAEKVTCPDGILDDPRCLVETATSRGYAVVAPDGTGGRPLRGVRTWNAGGDEYCASGAACARDIDDLGYTDDLLDEVQAAIPVDAGRIFATGLSNGGAMSHRLACQRADVFAAVAAVGGANQHADDGGPCDARAVLHLHGTLDPCWPFSGGGGDCIETEGRKTSVDETMTGWAQRNGCATTFVDTPLPDRDPADGTTSVRRAWDGCAQPTELVIIEGGGHTWPSGWSYLERAGTVSRDFDSNLLVDFFDAHPR